MRARCQSPKNLVMLDSSSLRRARSMRISRSSRCAAAACQPFHRRGRDVAVGPLDRVVEDAVVGLQLGELHVRQLHQVERLVEVLRLVDDQGGVPVDDDDVALVVAERFAGRFLGLLVGEAVGVGLLGEQRRDLPAVLRRARRRTAAARRPPATTRGCSGRRRCRPPRRGAARPAGRSTGRARGGPPRRAAGPRRRRWCRRRTAGRGSRPARRAGRPGTARGR